jgi:hypothetical protein
MIKLNPNCRNGEHLFIPAVTHIDGRDHVVSALLCQHCLYYVSDKAWYEHLQEHFKSEQKETISTEPRNIKPMLASARSSVVTNIERPANRKKRGPKPKAKGKIQGLTLKEPT